MYGQFPTFSRLVGESLVNSGRILLLNNAGARSHPVDAGSDKVIQEEEMSYIDHFIDAKKPLCRPRAVAVEEDWELLCHVFPEPGFRSFFLGHIVSKLAKELKANGINDYFDRQSRPEFTTITGFLSGIKFVRAAEAVGSKDNPNERRGVGVNGEEVQDRSGEPTNTEESPSGEDESRSEET